MPLNLGTFDISQFFTPEIQAIAYSALNFFVTWLASKLPYENEKVFKVVTTVISILYVSLTFDFSLPLLPQLSGKVSLIILTSTGIWKWWRDMSGKTAASRQALIEHGKEIANTENQQNVTVIPVQSESPVTFGQPVQVSSSYVPSDDAPKVDTLQSFELASQQQFDQPLQSPPSTQTDDLIKDQEP